MNLTEASDKFKFFLKILFVGAALYYLVTLVIIPTGKKGLAALFPPKNPPTVAYGNLDPLVFVRKETNSQTPRYSLNTVTGRLPKDFPDRMKVYKTREPSAMAFTGGTNAEKNAAFLGFYDSDLISDFKTDIYRWRKLETGSILEIDTKTRELTLTTDIAKNAMSFPKGLLDDKSVEKDAKNLFKGIWRFDDALYPNGELRIEYGAIQGSGLVIAQSSRDRQIAMVDFYRKIGDYPLLGPDPKKSLLHAIIRRVTDDRTPLNYPVIEAYYWEIEPESRATYPILTVQEAWDSIKKDKGVLVHVREKDYNPFQDYNPLRIDTILIDNIYLAYYEPNDRPRYVQPIYVFEGNYQARGTEGGEVTLYYPAIRGEYINSQ